MAFNDPGKADGPRASITPTNAETKFKDGFELDKNTLKTNMAKIEENPLAMRIFTHVAQTSTAIQVAWSHPANFQKVIRTNNEDNTVIIQKQHIQYILEYGIGVKFNGKEQFRTIYKGKAHKCIITDLMPRTTFRLRVAPVLHIEMALS